VAEIAGRASAETIRTLLENTHQHDGVMATLIAFVMLLFGASGVFVELRDSLNIIWEAPQRVESGVSSFIQQRLISFVMVVALCVLLLGSLLVSTALTLIDKLFSDVVPLHISVLSQLANVLLTLIAFTILFGLIFKFVPNLPIRWQEVSVGALVTAVLFAIGKALLALYLATTAVGSTYGAAGSLVALVVWVYYSSQIFFFGAVFTRVYAAQFGSAVAKQQRRAVRLGGSTGSQIPSTGTG
jgi:membrane protein